MYGIHYIAIKAKANPNFIQACLTLFSLWEDINFRGDFTQTKTNGCKFFTSPTCP